MQGNRAALAVVIGMVVIGAAWLFVKRSGCAPGVQLIPLLAWA